MTGAGGDWGLDPPEPASKGWRTALGDAVAGLRESREVSHNIRRDGRVRDLPSHDALVTALIRLSSALFPTHYGQVELTADRLDGFVETALADALATLEEQVRRDLACAPTNDHLAPGTVAARAGEIVGTFARRLPELRNTLVSDLVAAYAGDPAARGYPEIMLAYPGLLATRYHRVAHALNELGAPLVARLVSQIAHSRTGIDIHPGACIGCGFFIDHGTGVVIGETAVIGDRVRIYQAVTLGARSFATDVHGALVKGNQRHPIVEDDVVIYAGATVLGRITVGAGSVIGGNVWLTRSVPPGTTITQANLRHGDGAPWGS